MLNVLSAQIKCRVIHPDGQIGEYNPRKPTEPQSRIRVYLKILQSTRQGKIISYHDCRSSTKKLLNFTAAEFHIVLCRKLL